MCEPNRNDLLIFGTTVTDADRRASAKFQAICSKTSRRTPELVLVINWTDLLGALALVEVSKANRLAVPHPSR